ncbi:hypothetical protein L228DRAFT_237612 [Xylona heveae TC161]|uniref:Uncharacterized protein n=1 Tax=Xylona heveae (strain CBS 132557 / TC161) TaxID=1328760 RepID=A0A165ICP7_XYLHT|nr:hypothetical protein L228DRAFT_237612 [Xylona heveae TC161]KZF24711.1 hypothetical protein L228DRAFT_237612 [Xylona heveae TC161]
MSSPDGVLSAATRPDPFSVPAKRKRTEGETKEESNGVVEKAHESTTDSASESLNTFLEDILEILKQQDTTPSLLNQPLPVGETDAAEDLPASKRQKLSGTNDTSTITSKVLAKRYGSVSEFARDIDVASSAILEAQDRPSNGAHQQQQATSPKRLLSAGILALKKNFNALLLREKMLKSPHFDIELTVPGESSGEVTIKEESTGPRETREVLTLLGNAPQPRQLFSSLQTPVSSTRSSQGEKADTYPPLREGVLPNGIVTTKIIPLQSSEINDDRMHVPTLGELFTPPPTLAPLNPPRRARSIAPAGNSISWYNPEDEEINASRARTTGLYPFHDLATGHSLKYNSSTPATKPLQPEGLASSADATADEKSKEDALFRSVYSGFAPTRDDSAAIVPEATKNRMWWRKKGEDIFGYAFNVFGDSASETDRADSSGKAQLVSEGDKALQEAVESFVPADPPGDFSTTSKEADDLAKQTDEILSEISDLLETLNSYQRNRNLSLASDSRYDRGSQLSAMVGSPSSPTSAEVDVYNLLKSQLSVLIASLPPYAVAKLSGDQLEALNISTRIPVESPSYRGVMEEEEAVARARAAALNAAASTPPPARAMNPALAAQPALGPYQTPHTIANPYKQRQSYLAQVSTPRPGPPTTHVPGQYFGPTPAPGRPTSANAHRGSISAQPSYQTPRPPSSQAQRAPYPPQAYTPSMTRNAQTPYAQTNPHQYSQQQNQQAYQYNQQFQATAAPMGPGPNRSYQTPAQPQYPQRAAPTTGYGSSQSPYPQAKSASPSKTYPPTTPAQPRQYYQPPQGQNPPQLGASGFATYMTAEQQALILERQRAQLAQQNQTLQQNRLASQANMTRQTSTTPQPQTTQQTPAQPPQQQQQQQQPVTQSAQQPQANAVNGQPSSQPPEAPSTTGTQPNGTPVGTN